MSPRVYYLYPGFPLVFAAGSVMWEWWLEARQRRWRRVAYPALLIAAGAISAPFATPVLPVETYIHYTRALHISPPATETQGGVVGWGGGGRAELWPSRRDRSLRAEIWIAVGDQRSPKLFPVGTARLHRRKYDRHG